MNEDEEARRPRSTPPRPRGGGSVLAAAMLGLADVLQPEKTEITIEQRNDDPLDDLDLDLAFGDLPPLGDPDASS